MDQAQKKYFIIGFATACAELCRNGRGEQAEILMQEAGYSSVDFFNAGVDDYDLDALQEASVIGYDQRGFSPRHIRDILADYWPGNVINLFPRRNA
jgi:hypothetical protein